MSTEITKFAPRTWRVRMEGHEFFGQIRQAKKAEWHAEIRKVATGDLVRFAGIWPRQRDAIEEVEHILNQ